MNFHSHDHPVLQAAAIAIWENEGGALSRYSVDALYGRRVESDRSWTVYHVFSGVAARFAGEVMTGLSRSAATDNMICLNLRNQRRRRSERVTLLAPGLRTRETCEVQS
jgi:hypothetical protein